MRATTVLSLGIAAATLPPAVAQSDHDPWTQHRSTSVLYAGKEGGHREKEFGAFLKKWFDKSATIPFEDLSMATAENFDVVIVDWVSQYSNDGYTPRTNRLFSPPKTLGPKFTKPMISMTYVSTRVRSGYKLDWF
jgi:hypothetical protein